MTEIIFEVTEEKVDGGYSSNAFGFGIDLRGDLVEEIGGSLRAEQYHSPLEGESKKSSRRRRLIRWGDGTPETHPAALRAR